MHYHYIKFQAETYFDEIKGCVKSDGARYFADPLLEITTKTKIVAR